MHKNVYSSITHSSPKQQTTQIAKRKDMFGILYSNKKEQRHQGTEMEILEAPELPIFHRHTKCIAAHKAILSEIQKVTGWFLYIGWMRNAYLQQVGKVSYTLTVNSTYTPHATAQFHTTKRELPIPASPRGAKSTSYLALQLLQLLPENRVPSCLTVIANGTWIHVSHRAITKNQFDSSGQAHEHLQQFFPTPVPRSSAEGRGKNTHLSVLHWQGSGL